MWTTRWSRISGRVRGLRTTAKLLFDGCGCGAGQWDIRAYCNGCIIPEAKEIFQSLKDFHRDFRELIPASARAALDEFLSDRQGIFRSPSDIGGVMGVAVALATVQEAIDFHLAGVDGVGRSITERAFEHLQRSIVVDHDLRTKWKFAFATGETSCEKLGAVHLLLHGIWAFKVNSGGERTDLVFGTPLGVGHVERSAPSAMVLTEWKMARTAAEVFTRFEEARRQASLYAGGSLSDLELTSVRFLVVVAEKQTDVPEDCVQDEVVYRHRLIAVDPDPPSVAARRPA